jgi:hypothetical protein
LLIIKGGKCVHSETHNGISEAWLKEVTTH